MTYYSTGKSPYLPSRGKAVESSNATTANILLKNGALVVSLSDLEVTEIQVPKEVIERETKVQTVEQPKKRGNPKWAKK